MSNKKFKRAEPDESEKKVVKKIQEVRLCAITHVVDPVIDDLEDKLKYYKVIEDTREVLEFSYSPKVYREYEYGIMQPINSEPPIKTIRDLINSFNDKNGRRNPFHFWSGDRGDVQAIYIGHKDNKTSECYLDGCVHLEGLSDDVCSRLVLKFKHPRILIAKELEPPH